MMMMMMMMYIYDYKTFCSTEWYCSGQLEITSKIVGIVHDELQWWIMNAKFQFILWENNTASADSNVVN